MQPHKLVRLRVLHVCCAAALGLASVTAARGQLSYTATVLCPLPLTRGIDETLTPDTPTIFDGQSVGSISVGSNSGVNAALWSDSSGQFINLNPTNASKNSSSDALATDGSQQVGWDEPTGSSYHAFLWSGTADSGIDLNPMGFTNTIAYGVGGGQQVGVGITATTVDALLWTGTAVSAIDLNPVGFRTSLAIGTNGMQQVGKGSGSATGNQNHALLWSGTAESAVDLNPAGALSSVAYGISGNQEVGSANDQAYLWNGTAASAVDLGPTSFPFITASAAFATDGTQQVGYASDNEGGPYEAFIWSGTAASAMDLQSLLPGDSAEWESVADSIDASGNVYGIAEGTYNGFTGNFAVEWSPRPRTRLAHPPGRRRCRAAGAAQAEANLRRGRRLEQRVKSSDRKMAVVAEYVRYS